MTDVAWQSGEAGSVRGREGTISGGQRETEGRRLRGRAGVRDGEREGTDVERGGEGDRKRSMAVP